MRNSILRFCAAAIGLLSLSQDSLAQTACGTGQSNVTIVLYKDQYCAAADDNNRITFTVNGTQVVGVPVAPATIPAAPAGTSNFVVYTTGCIANGSAITISLLDAFGDGFSGTISGANYWVFVDNELVTSGDFTTNSITCYTTASLTDNILPNNSCATSASGALTTLATGAVSPTTLAEYTAGAVSTGIETYPGVPHTQCAQFTVPMTTDNVDIFGTGTKLTRPSGGATSPTGSISYSVYDAACASVATGLASGANVSGLTPGDTYTLCRTSTLPNAELPGAISTFTGLYLAVRPGAPTCTQCQTACATSAFYDDYYSAQAGYVAGEWGTAPYNSALSTLLDGALATAQSNTVCTEFTPPAGSSFVGFDALMNYVDVNSSNTANGVSAVFQGAYQNIGGTCTQLVISGSNAYGGPEFNNTLGATGVPGTDAGAYDNTIAMNVCYTYSTDALSTTTDDIEGVSVAGYTCPAFTNITATPGACVPASDTYTLTVQLAFNPTDLPNASESGALADMPITIVVNGVSYSRTFTAAQQATSPATFTIANLPSNGATLNMEAYFTNASGAVASPCRYSETNVGTAPASCAPTCTANNGTWAP